MMILCGQSNRAWHYWAGKYPGSVGLLIGPSYRNKVPVDAWMPYALDNDAFSAWKHKKPWDFEAWKSMLGWARLLGKPPLWVLIPDAVGDRETTLKNWETYSPALHRIDWPLAFAVQDGMTPDDVPAKAAVVFVGGTDGWKFPNLKMWTEHFPRVHCARVTSQQMLEACEREGCESVDGTGWFREPSRSDHLPMLERFIEGHRNKTPELKGLICV